MQVIEGDFSLSEESFALVASRFNQPITQRLVDGACDCLKRHGIDKITLVWVPGAFEIPLVAKKMAQSGKYSAVICLGAIIRGETAHFDYVASQTASGILQASLETEIPVLFSVLTTENVEQAEMRSGIKGGNVGFNSALAAIEMVSLMEQLAREELCVLNN